MGRKNNKFLSENFSLRKNLGVTVIELVVVVAILGIFIGIVLLSIKPQLQMAKSRDGRRKADLQRISTALEDYAGDHPCYPERIYSDDENCLPSDEIKPYLSKIPCDPLTNKPYDYIRIDGCKEYVVYANFESGEQGKYGRADYAVASSNVAAIPTLPPVTIAPTAAPTAAPTTVLPTEGPTPTGTFDYGCFGGQCLPRNGRDCSPKYPAGCYGADTCLNPANECR